MNKTISASMPRREFLISVPMWTLGTYFSGRILGRDALAQSPQSLPEDLSPEELKIVDKSVLAKDLPTYFGKGYSCAESMLLVSLRYLKKPEELVWIAAGFGGGMLHRDVCGFLTGGCMTLGLAAGMLDKERKEAKEWNKQKIDAYWEWWTSQAPLRCADIRKEGKSAKVCRRLGPLAAAKIEELI
jgi:hypothetical protein